MINKLIGGLLILLSLVTQTGCDSSRVGLRASALAYPLQLEFYADRSRAVVGEPIHIRFTVTNIHQQQRSWVEESPDTPVMDISVKVVGGPRLLAWSDQNPDKVAHRLEWKPGEVKVIEWVWIPKQEDIASGYYQDVFLTGLLYSDSKIIQSAGVTVCASNFCR